MPKAEKITAIAEYIDKQIHHNYHIYPCNYIAYDLLYGMKRFETFYSEKEETNFKNYISEQINKIEIENKDLVFLRKKMLEMYSNPLKNKLLADNIKPLKKLYDVRANGILSTGMVIMILLFNSCSQVEEDAIDIIQPVLHRYGHRWNK